LAVTRAPPDSGGELADHALRGTHPAAASASTIALPTTTPSASRAVARACAGVLIPKPTASGSELADRTRADVLGRGPSGPDRARR